MTSAGPEFTDADVIEALCLSLNEAHDEILRLQGATPEQVAGLDWPTWSGPAHSLRMAERRLGKRLAKTSHVSLYDDEGALQ